MVWLFFELAHLRRGLGCGFDEDGGSGGGGGSIDAVEQPKSKLVCEVKSDDEVHC